MRYLLLTLIICILFAFVAKKYIPNSCNLKLSKPDSNMQPVLNDSIKKYKAEAENWKTLYQLNDTEK